MCVCACTRRYIAWHAKVHINPTLQCPHHTRRNMHMHNTDGTRNIMFTHTRTVPTGLPTGAHNEASIKVAF